MTTDKTSPAPMPAWLHELLLDLTPRSLLRRCEPLPAVEWRVGADRAAVARDLFTAAETYTSRRRSDVA